MLKDRNQDQYPKTSEGQLAKLIDNYEYRLPEIVKLPRRKGEVRLTTDTLPAAPVLLP